MLQTELRLTKNQNYVLRAVYELRLTKAKTLLEHSWVEQKTIALKKTDGEQKISKVARQQWTAPFGNSPTERAWAAIGEAVRGRLPYNHPIEKIIRDCKSSDSALVADLKDKIDVLEARVQKAESARVQLNDELDEFKNAYYAKQCTDAHYRVNFEKTIATNKRLTEEGTHNKNIIRGLLAEQNVLKQRVVYLEAKQADSQPGLAMEVNSIIRPKIYEPKLSGRGQTLEDEEYLKKYEKAIIASLDELECAAKNKNPEVTIIFHDFNCEAKDLINKGQIPFKSARTENMVFACHGASSDIRMSIFRRLSVISASPPLVVVICGTGKIVHLPVKERTTQNDHEWLVALVSMGAFRYRPVNGFNEGYDTVVFRRLHDKG